MVFLECYDKDGNEKYVRSDLIEWFKQSNKSTNTQSWYTVKFSCFTETVESNEDEYFMHYMLGI